MYAVCKNKIPLQLFQIQTTVCLWVSFPWELKVQTRALTWKSINVRNKNKTRIYRCSTIYKSSTFIGKLTLNVLFHFDLVSLSFMITVFLFFFFFFSPRPIICLNGRLITKKKILNVRNPNCPTTLLAKPRPRHHVYILLSISIVLYLSCTGQPKAKLKVY